MRARRAVMRARAPSAANREDFRQKGAGTRLATRAAVHPPCNDERSLLARSLELTSHLVIECDESLAVIAEHGRTAGLTAQGRLVPTLETAVFAQLATGHRASPFALQGLPEFRLVQVERGGDGTVLVWLRHHGNGRALLSRQLRERYGFKLRSQQLLTLLTQGLRNREIAAQLGLREATVKTYLHEVYGTLGVKSRTQAIAELRRTLQLEHL